LEIVVSRFKRIKSDNVEQELRLGALLKSEAD
jgi:hypothetical protein